MIPNKLAKVHEKSGKPIPVKLVFKSKIEPGRSVNLKLHIVSKGLMQVPGVDFTEKFSPVATDMSTSLFGPTCTILMIFTYFFVIEEENEMIKSSRLIFSVRTYLINCRNKMVK